MEHIQNFTTFSERLREENTLKLTEEKSAKQDKYANFFKQTMQKYDITSPSELSDENKPKFFAEIEAGWTEEAPVEAVTETKPVVEAKLNEEYIKSESDFMEYAMKILNKAHGEDFSEEKAKETAKGILSKADGDFGKAAGMLQSTLG